MKKATGSDWLNPQLDTAQLQAKLHAAESALALADELAAALVNRAKWHDDPQVLVPTIDEITRKARAYQERRKEQG